MEGENTAKAVLQPRNPGESIKVAETVLKRRDRNLKAAGERAAKFAEIRKQKQQYKKGKIQIVRAEKILKDAMIRSKDIHRIKVTKKKHAKKKASGNFKVLTVVRNGRHGGCGETKRVLKKLGLTKRNSLIFMANSPENCQKLLTVKPFAYWGKCSFKTMFNIVHKKAVFKDPENPEEQVVLSDNTLIEKHLGKYNVLCTEDLAHVLSTRGKHFEAVTERLWAIPVGNVRKANGMVGDAKWTYGDQADEMDASVCKLLGD